MSKSPAYRYQSRSTRTLATVALALALTAVGALTAPAARAADLVIAAVGDTACDPLSQFFNGGIGFTANCRAKAVGDAIVADTDVDAFLPLGDLQEDCGGLAAYQQAYDVEFGALLPKTYPVPGNHEYRDALDYPGGTDCPAPLPNGAQPTAEGYFSYLQAARAAGHLPANLPADATNPAKGFYTYNVGPWNVIAINTNDMCLSIACRGPNAATAYKGSAQEQWLRNHLAANVNRCVIAYMHYPRWSSNLAAARTQTPDPTDSDVSPLVTGIWNDLYQGGAELYLSGHAHNYERFHPMNATGQRDDANGVRQFVVGTGGVNLELNQPDIANSAARMNPRSFGYLRLVLKNGSYSWAFRGINGQSYDAGSANCHGAPVTVSAPAAGAVVNAGSPLNVSAKFSAPTASDRVDFYIGAKKVASVTRAQAQCATNITTDPAVFYTSPYCVYSAVATTSGLSAGSQTLRAVANSLDASVPSATTTGSISVSVRNLVTGISSTQVGSTAVTQIASPTTGSLSDAAYSRTLSRITYASPAGIVVANANGSAPQVIAGTVGARLPDFAANDTRIVYLKGGAIFSVPVAGGTAQTLLGAGALSISVSPAGARVLYQLRLPTGQTDIFVMNANGSGKRNVTRSKAINETQPAWRAPKIIAFARKSTRWAVFTMPLTGGKQVQITGTSLNCQQPAYSPNGLRLACVTRLTGTRTIIRTMTARGLTVRTLSTQGTTPAQPVWANNTRVTYTAN